MKRWIAWLILFVVILAVLNRRRVMSDMAKIQLGKNFVLAEFVRTTTGFDNVPSELEVAHLKLLVTNVLQPLRDYLARPVRISSGYRSAAVNDAVGGSATSQHRTGQAADIEVDGVTNKEIIEAIRYLGLPFDQLIDEDVKGERWVHVSYSDRHRSQLLSARFDSQQGKVVYSPYTA